MLTWLVRDALTTCAYKAVPVIDLLQTDGQIFYGRESYADKKLCCAGVQCAHAAGQVCILCAGSGQRAARGPRRPDGPYRGHGWGSPVAGALNHSRI